MATQDDSPMIEAQDGPPKMEVQAGPQRWPSDMEAQGAPMR